MKLKVFSNDFMLAAFGLTVDNEGVGVGKGTHDAKRLLGQQQQMTTHW